MHEGLDALCYTTHTHVFWLMLAASQLGHHQKPSTWPPPRAASSPRGLLSMWPHLHLTSSPRGLLPTWPPPRMASSPCGLPPTWPPPHVASSPLGHSLGWFGLPHCVAAVFPAVSPSEPGGSTHSCSRVLSLLMEESQRFAHSLGSDHLPRTCSLPVPFSRGSSQPRDWTQVSHIAGRFFTS